MIKPQEIRIGNYVLLDDEKLVKVIWVKYDNVCIIEIGKEYPSAIVNISRISGIPLTEEILLKFGFEKLTSKKGGFLADTYTCTKGTSFIVNFDGVRLSVKAK